MADLRVNLLGKTLNGPVIGASGTYGYGVEYADMVDLTKLGGVCSKGLTLNGKPGNEGERLWETPSGLINSIGLQNPGVQHFIQHELPEMQTMGTAIFANLGGGCIEDYEEGTRLLNDTPVDFIELNISCPNVKHGGIAYGVKAESAKEVVSRVKAVCKKPLIVKLSPNAESIPEMAAACVEAGADALSLVNTFQAMAIDLERRQPVFKKCVRWFVRPCHPSHCFAYGAPSLQNCESSCNWFGRHCHWTGCFGVYYGRSNCRSGWHRKLCRPQSL